MTKSNERLVHEMSTVLNACFTHYTGTKISQDAVQKINDILRNENAQFRQYWTYFHHD